MFGAKIKKNPIPLFTLRCLIVTAAYAFIQFLSLNDLLEALAKFLSMSKSSGNENKG